MSNLEITDKDPNGIDQHTPGAKLDSGKMIAGEILTSFSNAMQAMLEVATFGASKYTRKGFLQVPNGEERYLDAMTRHLLKHGSGEEFDPETGFPHLHHALWNLAAVVEVRLRSTKSQLKEDALQREDLEKLVVSKFYGDYPPSFKQGLPNHELEEVVDAQFCTALINRIESLSKNLNQEIDPS